MEETYKYIIIGDEGVGKTSISLRYTDNVFSEKPSTIGVDFFSKTDRNVKIKIWDTAGACRFKSIIKSFYRYTVGAIIVYDITNKNSFDSVPSWIQEIKENTTNKCYTMLIGNKLDQDDKRKVSTEEGKKFAHKMGIPFFEVSAKDGTNVESSFYFFNSFHLSEKPESVVDPPLLEIEHDKCYPNC